MIRIFSNWMPWLIISIAAHMVALKSLNSIAEKETLVDIAKTQKSVEALLIQKQPEISDPAPASESMEKKILNSVLQEQLKKETSVETSEIVPEIEESPLIQPPEKTEEIPEVNKENPEEQAKEIPLEEPTEEPLPPKELIQAASDEVITENQNPVAIVNPAPAYPRIAVRKGLVGTVVLALTIDNDGRPLECRVIKSSGHKILDQRALDTVEKRWLFEISSMSERETTVSITFSLDG